jgi:hypothetical protein
VGESEPSTTRPRSRRRPLGVILIAVLLLLTSVTCFLVAAAALVDGAVPWATVPPLGEAADLLRPGPLLTQPVVAGAGIAVGSAALVVAIGFFLLKSWAWTGLMLLAAVSLTINLVAVVLGDPDEASMAVAIAAVLYANQRRIQLLFREEEVVAFEGTRAGDVRAPG